jgi:uncharacterized protein YbjQ (UPF0145 family)
MIVTPGSTVEGQRVVRTLGLVMGNTVATKSVSGHVLARWRSLLGGEVEPYSELTSEASGEAIDRMVAEAERRGANAILDVNFSTTHLMAGAAEILVYGNAVVLDWEAV